MVLEVGAWSAMFPTDLTPRGVWWSYSTASKPKRSMDRSADPARAADLARGPPMDSSSLIRYQQAPGFGNICLMASVQHFPYSQS